MANGRGDGANEDKEGRRRRWQGRWEMARAIGEADEERTWYLYSIEEME